MFSLQGVQKNPAVGGTSNSVMSEAASSDSSAEIFGDLRLRHAALLGLVFRAKT